MVQECSSEPTDLTRLLRRWVAGVDGSVDELTPLVLPELRKLAHFHLRQGGFSTLQPTEVIHEAFIKLVGAKLRGFDSRGHFFAFASKLMRDLLVDHAHAQRRQKRGGQVEKMSAEALETDPKAEGIDLETVVIVDQVLRRLEAYDSRQSRVVELKFFAGMTLSEIASTLGLSLATVERLWSVARRRLAAALESVPAREESPVGCADGKRF